MTTKQVGNSPQGNLIQKMQVIPEIKVKVSMHIQIMAKAKSSKEMDAMARARSSMEKVIPETKSSKEMEVMAKAKSNMEMEVMPEAKASLEKEVTHQPEVTREINISPHMQIMPEKRGMGTISQEATLRPRKGEALISPPAMKVSHKVMAAMEAKGKRLHKIPFITRMLHRVPEGNTKMSLRKLLGQRGRPLLPLQLEKRTAQGAAAAGGQAPRVPVREVLEAIPAEHPHRIQECIRNE